MTETGAAPIDRAAALALAGGDEALLLEILALFLDDCPAQLDAMREAAARRDCHALARIAHGLKGALQAIGARHAARLAEVVEGGGCETLAALERELHHVRRAALEAGPSSARP
jgi:HPt (histidine-containing phosphotransfer) domain-containing protein